MLRRSTALAILLPANLPLRANALALKRMLASCVMASSASLLGMGCVTKIATAHTLDDQAETLLLRIFRGTGIRGLSAIQPRVRFEEEGRLVGEVVRPLLGIRRAVLQQFLRDRAQTLA